MASRIPSECVVMETSDEKAAERQETASAGMEVGQEGPKVLHSDSPGGKLEWDSKAGAFSQTLTIQNHTAFTLRPVVVTDGELKGRRVIVLDEEPPKTKFLDLAAELRVLIYGHLLEEDSPIQLTTNYRSCHPRTCNKVPVRGSFDDRKAHTSKGFTWDHKTRKWLGQQSSNYAIASVSKQLAVETLPIIYGNNKFQFTTLGGLEVWLRTIDSMRQYLKHLIVSGNHPWDFRIARAPFDELVPATNLQSLTLCLRAIASRGTDYNSGTGRLELKFLIREASIWLHEIHPMLEEKKQAGTSTLSILGVIKLSEGTWCQECMEGHVRGRACVERSIDRENIWCDDPGMAAHITKLSAELRAALEHERDNPFDWEDEEVSSDSEAE